jgi:2-methylcitrate dehydratase PrpD
LAGWVSGAGFADLPEDVVAATKLRVLDVIGLGLAGAKTDFGRSVRAAAQAMASPGSAGFGEPAIAWE